MLKILGNDQGIEIVRRLVAVFHALGLERVVCDLHRDSCGGIDDKNQDGDPGQLDHSVQDHGGTRSHHGWGALAATRWVCGLDHGCVLGKARDTGRRINPAHFRSMLAGNTHFVQDLGTGASEECGATPGGSPHPRNGGGNRVNTVGTVAPAVRYQHVSSLTYGSRVRRLLIEETAPGRVAC